ncbi:MAG: Putative sporulation transcription regulator WhiA [Clostridia bacterium 41_269]|nr:MAG: Putative sporulation transcription regulator WhiA [Clostridia bacterium 41_269]
MPSNKCCQIAELTAFKEIDGNEILRSNGKLMMEFTTEAASVARKVFKLIKNTCGINPEIFVSQKNTFKKRNVYSVIVEKEALESFSASEELKPCCTKAYLRGAFLAGGSIIDPQRAYHLEISCTRKIYAQKTADLMKSCGLKPGISKRKNSYVVYLKEAEQIANFLNIVGAHSSLLSMENIRIYKGMRNRVNRLVNCETANMGKVINASLKQIEDIELIDRVVGIENLPEKLYEVAKLRLVNPESSLKELGEMLNPPVGKSGVNHRMRRLSCIAEKLRRNSNFRGGC